MSKDFFKVKRGLNIKPQDPSGLSDLQDGDIIVDSTDDNRLKVYDSVGGDFASVGTGGSSGNILSEIEKLTPVTSNVVAAQETTTFLPIDDNNKSVKATFSGSDGSIRYEAAASADLDGVQGVVIVWIKTSLDNLTLTATKDGVAQNNGLTINATNKWRQYKIPVVLGDASYGFQITASGAVAGDVFIDEAFVKVEKQETQLGQAQFVGSQYTSVSNCQWSNNGTSWSAFPVDNDCTYSNIGNIEAPDTNIPAIKIPNARTDGYYKVEALGTFINSNTLYACTFSLSSGSNFDNQPTTETFTDEARFNNTVSGNFKFNTSGDKTIQLISLTNNASGDCLIRATAARDANLTFLVHFFPDSNSTIVSQDTELTAETANEFSAVIDSDGTVISQNYDFIDSCSNSNNCTFKDNIFTVNPSVTCTTVNDSGSDADNCEINSISTTNVTFNTVAANPGTLTNQNVRKYITVSKQGTDVNKSQTIVGKFTEQNMQDKYSESEILWGEWNGEQLYRRCFTVGSDITVNGTVITTWDTGLKPVSSLGYNTTGGWVLLGVTAGSNLSVILYNDTNGRVVVNLTGTYQVSEGTRYCMDYTK